MGKYQAYPEYKDSGIEWIGDIPKHWELWKLTHAYEEIGSGTTPPSTDAEWYGGTVPWVTTGELREKEIYSTTKNVTDDALRSFTALRKYPKGSIAIAMYGATIGRLGIFGVEATTNQACCVFTKSSVVDNHYLYYWLQAFRQDIVNLASGGGQPNINQEVVASLKVSCPDKVGQEIIVSFLDHETAKIDTLIDKQQQLIRLLKEKRQAVISHAVTKGLNPSAPMRDSGVEWLGEVPEHWVVSKVKFEYKNLDGRRVPLSTEERSYRQGDYPYYGASGIIDYVDDYIFDEGLVLVSEDGANLLARSSKIAFPAYGKYWVNNHAHILRPKDENIDFWSEVIEVRDLTPYISGAAQPKFTSEALSNLVIAVPTNEDEICQIAEYIREQKEKYSNLISKANKSIKLMQERRTALISAAVTGKIDVRHHVSRPSGNDTSEVSA